MTGQHRDFTEDFRHEAVRLSRESGRTVRQVAEDLGIGLSTLSRWRRDLAETELLSGPHDDLERENEILRQERDLLKCAAQ